MGWEIVVYLIIAILAAAVAYASMPKPASKKPPSLADIDVPTAEDGRAISVVFGEAWVDDANVINYGALRTTPIKTKSGK